MSDQVDIPEPIPEFAPTPADVSEGIQGIDFHKLFMLERWNGKRFQIQEINNVFFHMMKFIDYEDGEEYISIYANGIKDEDFFTKVPILRPFEGVMMFGDMPVEKTEKGWKILK